MDKKQLINIGKIIGVFGIKGELKVLSDFIDKEKVLLPDKVIYIGTNRIKEVIKTHRIHQNYDLITLENYININEILKYKGLSIYVKRNTLDRKYFLNDLIGMNVIDNNITYGKIIDYYNFNGCNTSKVIVGSNDMFYTPYNFGVCNTSN